MQEPDEGTASSKQGSITWGSDHIVDFEARFFLIMLLHLGEGPSTNHLRFWFQTPHPTCGFATKHLKDHSYVSATCFMSLLEPLELHHQSSMWRELHQEDASAPLGSHFGLPPAPPEAHFSEIPRVILGGSWDFGIEAPRKVPAPSSRDLKGWYKVGRGLA